VASSEPQNTSVVARIYEVVSVKKHPSNSHMIYRTAPDGFALTATLPMFIQKAYEVYHFQISEGPSWLYSERFDIEAKMNKSVADQLDKLSTEEGRHERNRMLQRVLVDRFKLTILHDIRERRVYALVVAKNGPKFRQSKTE
jgi:uncharacterized protein (TIGR03435 family)